MEVHRGSARLLHPSGQLELFDRHGQKIMAQVRA